MGRHREHILAWMMLHGVVCGSLQVTLRRVVYICRGTLEVGGKDHGLCSSMGLTTAWHLSESI